MTTTETVKKQKPVKSSNKAGAAPTKKGIKSKARAFVNWILPLKSGNSVRGSKGFPIYEPNVEYPNPQEDWLVEMAKKNGGSLEVTMKVQVHIVNDEAVVMPDLEDIDFS